MNEKTQIKQKQIKTQIEWLMSDQREPDSLKGLKYTIFGLGNKTYEHYNFMGRQFDKKLEQLGAGKTNMNEWKQTDKHERTTYKMKERN